MPTKLLRKRNAQREVEVVTIEKRTVEVYVYKDKEYENEQQLKEAVSGDMFLSLWRLIGDMRDKYNLSDCQAIKTLRWKIRVDGRKWNPCDMKQELDKDLLNNDNLFELVNTFTQYKKTWEE
jgi:hypothetical protein